MKLPTRSAAAFAATSALIGAILTAPAVFAEDNARGAKLYDLCAQCHGDAGEGKALALAPAIANFGEWYIKAQLVKFRSGARGTHFDDITGMRMRPMALTLRSEEDLAAVAAYAAALPDVVPEATLAGGDATSGRGSYAPCAGCHGMDGAGMQAVGAPSLHTSDWYFKKQMENYKAGIRGSNPRDTNGSVMVGMATIIQDEQALNNLIAYVRTLSK